MKINFLKIEDYEHPWDKSARNTLEKMPGFTAIIRKINEISFDRLLRVNYTGSSLKVNSNNAPEVYEVLQEACEILSIDRQPELYFHQDSYGINADTTGVEKSIIVLSSECADSLSPEELMFVIARELGHIKSQHVLYYQTANYLPTIANLVGRATLGIGSLITGGVEMALQNWKRMSELTADRAGLLACQQPEVAASVLVKIAGLPKKYYSSPTIVDEFIKQAKEFESYGTLDQIAKVIGVMNQSHPWIVMRAAELFEWVDSGEYTRVMSKMGKNLLHGRFRLMVLGDIKHGKSTLLNVLLGKRLLPTAVNPCTAILTILRFGSEEKVTVHFKDERTETLSFDQFSRKYTIDPKEAKRFEQSKKDAFPDVSYAVVEYPLKLLQNGVEILDSPGLNDTDERNQLTLGYINQCHAIFFVLNATKPCTMEERRYLENYLKDRGLTIFFLINRWDELQQSAFDPDDPEEVRKVEEEQRQVFSANLRDYCQIDGSDLYDERVFETSALNALRYSLKGKPLDGTGIPEFVGALELFLTKERAVSELRQARILMRQTYQRVHEAVDRHIPLLNPDITKLHKRIKSVEPEFRKLEEIRDSFKQEIAQMRDTRADAIAESIHSYISQLERTFETDFKPYMPEIDSFKFLVNQQREQFTQGMEESFKKYANDKMAEWSKGAELDIKDAFSQLADSAKRYSVKYGNVTDTIDFKLSGSINISGTASAEEEYPGWARFAIGTKTFLFGDSTDADLGVFNLNRLPINGSLFIALNVALVVAGAGTIQMNMLREKFIKMIAEKMQEKLPEAAAQLSKEVYREVRKGFDEYEAEVSKRMNEDIQARRDELDQLLEQKEKGEYQREAEIKRLKELENNVYSQWRSMESGYEGLIRSRKITMNGICEKILYVSELTDSDELRSDAEAVCEYMGYPAFRIAVFAPFNHGKSTLLNALLGNRALPIALRPTTGTAIVIKYGKNIKTCVRTNDGAEVCENGTDLLKKFAVLDGDRCMREDVVSVEVSCPHTLLAKGVELIDLPGTDDMEAQNHLVYSQLLTVDLVVQVLDARKLFTLGEVSKLQDWLMNRGITTSIFVLNFMNLLEREDCKEVASRARSLAGELRGDLPNNMSNLYRVDALPALRARMKGDVAAANQSGILLFESNLDRIVDNLSPGIEYIRLPRLLAIREQLKQNLLAQAQPLETEVQNADRDRQAAIERLRGEVEQVKNAFKASVMNLGNWLSVSALLDRYKSEAAKALEDESFRNWETGVFQQALLERQESVMKYVNQACDEFGHKQPSKLSISLPADPTRSRPSVPSTSDPTAKSVATATAVGWLLGGPVGGAIAAGITHVFNEGTKLVNEEDWSNYRQQLSQVCTEGATDYLKRFSNQAINQLHKYIKNVEYVFTYSIPPEQSEIKNKRKRLKKLRMAVDLLEKELHND